MSEGYEDWGKETEASETFDDFGMSTDGVDSSKVGSGHRTVDKKGDYHFLIESVTPKPSPYGTDRDGNRDMTKQRKPSILLMCKSLANPPGLCPAGTVHYHELIFGGKGPGVAITPTDQEQTLNFLVGIGILEKRGEKIIDPDTGTSAINVGSLAKRLKDRQFIGRVTLTKGREKDDGSGNWPDRFEFSWGRGCYPVDADEVSDVPKSLEHLKLIGMEHCMPGAKVGTPKAPAKSALDDLDV